MFKRLTNFFKDYDIRWKLKKISQKTGINFYPKQFKFSLFKRIHASFIFNLIFFVKINQKRRNLYDFIKSNSNYKTSSINFLISPQSSGSNFLRQCINSYFEITNNLGNGIPFHDKLNDKWITSAPAIVYSDMWRSINFERNIAFEKLDLNLKKEFFSKRVIFSRYPAMHCDLYDLNNDNINPLILIREPKSCIISRYIYLIKHNSYYSKFFDKKKNINTKIISDEIKRLDSFYKYWINDLKQRKIFFVLDYNELIKNPHESIFKTLEFFNYENINAEVIKKASEYNSIDFIKRFYGNLEMARFSNPENKSLIKNQIENYLDEYLKKIDIKENFLSLLNIGKKNDLYKKEK